MSHDHMLYGLTHKIFPLGYVLGFARLWATFSAVTLKALINLSKYIAWNAEVNIGDKLCTTSMGIC